MSSDDPRDGVTPGIGELTDQPVRLDRVCEPRLGPSFLYATAYRALIHPLAVVVEQGKLAARLFEASLQPPQLRLCRFHFRYISASDWDDGLGSIVSRHVSTGSPWGDGVSFMLL